MGFLRRAERLLARDRAAHLDHGMLVAALAARHALDSIQICPSTAEPSVEPVEEPLVELLLAGPEWRRAVSVQGGCFSRAEAGRQVNDP